MRSFYTPLESKNVTKSQKGEIMFKRVTIFVACILCTHLFAVEINVGKGRFHLKSSMNSLFSADCSLDITTLTLRDRKIELPYNLQLSYSIDLYKSDKLDKLTTFFTKPLTYEWPFVGSINNMVDEFTPLTTPVNYKVRGIDINMALLYPLWQNDKFFISGGINTGGSFPFMEMKDLSKSLKLLLKTLDITKTRVITYKIGPIFQAGYQYNKFTAHFLASYNYQTGSIHNSLLESSARINGKNSILDFALSYRFTPKLQGYVGYTYKKWNNDDINIKLSRLLSFQSTMFRSDFSIKNFYIGVSYSFF